MKLPDDRKIGMEAGRGNDAFLTLAIGLGVLLSCAGNFYSRGSGIALLIWPAALVWGSFLTNARGVGDTLPQRRWLPDLVRASRDR